MAKRASILLEHTKPTSWLPAFSALILLCLLPLVLVKIFHYARQPPSPPIDNFEIVQSTIDSLQAPQITTEQFEPDEMMPTQPLLTPLIQKPTPNATPNSSPITPSQKTTQDKTHFEQSIVAQRGDTLAKIFKRLGLNAKNLQEVVRHKPHSNILTHIKPGQTMEFTIHNHRVEKLIFPFSPIKDLVITEQGHHYQATFTLKQTTPKYQSVSATVKGSLAATALRNHVPYALIQQMSTIFGRDNEFKKGMRAGDQFSILYKAEFIDKLQVGKSEILAARYTSRGNTHEAIRYTNRDGSTNYYTPQGLSLKIGYDRYPVRFSHIGSPFSLSRYHPILHYRRPHYGIDLAAPMGTPIHAIGDGHIAKIERQGGYGNMIKINHNSVYSTIYGHLSRYEKGLFKGKFVKRGQVIGYVGQSGLASGPHCHFEFHINQQPKNPITIPLPHADPIPRREMTTFKQRMNQLLAALHRTPHGTPA